MIIKSAEFKFATDEFKKSPRTEYKEIAFIGRSNVGKSSLINFLTNNSKLAKTSSNPGKTKQIIHFLINNSWYLVDLPGYGFAKVSKTQREKFQKLINDYILKRDNLHCLFVLIDSRIPPQKIDIEFINNLGFNGIPFSIIFTKTDKVSQSKLNDNVKAFTDELLENWEELPKMFMSSAIKKTGKEEILNYIDEILNL
ncbi:MAG: ribosome biogenesis GTP-binding protein YihA/YsxC [Bacteroidales bacterium]|jgi:GTP-binding protein